MDDYWYRLRWIGYIFKGICPRWPQQFNQCVHIFFWNSHVSLSQEGLKVPVPFLDLNSSITCLETGETKKRNYAQMGWVQAKLPLLSVFQLVKFSRYMDGTQMEHLYPDPATRKHIPPKGNRKTTSSSKLPTIVGDMSVSGRIFQQKFAGIQKCQGFYEL